MSKKKTPKLNKTRNLVQMDSLRQNRGGFHGQSSKAKRAQDKARLKKDPDNE